MKTLSFTFSVNKIKTALVCAGKSDIRYYLNGVHFERHGKAMLAVATDGHRMSIFHEETPDMMELPDVFSVIIDRDTLTNAIRAHKSNTLPCVIIQVEPQAKGPRKVRIVDPANGSTIEANELEGKYPAWEKIIPRGTRTPSEICLSSAYLADYQKMQKALGTNQTGIGISTDGANNSVIVDIGDRDVFCILMAMRGDFTSVAPKWLDPPKPPGSFATFEERVSQLESEGLTTSDAQACADAEELAEAA